MYPHKHLLASLGVAAASLFFNQKVPFLTIQLTGFDVSVAFLSIIVGVFIDIDHLVDFLLNRRLPQETVETRFEKGRIYQPFHGIENVPILAILSVFFPFLVFPTISYLIHIAMDIYNNAIPHEAYSYIIKLRNIMTKTENMPERARFQK